jgi:hypothetical protein
MIVVFWELVGAKVIPCILSLCSASTFAVLITEGTSDSSYANHLRYLYSTPIALLRLLAIHDGHLRSVAMQSKLQLVLTCNLCLV